MLLFSATTPKDYSSTLRFLFLQLWNAFKDSALPLSHRSPDQLWRYEAHPEGREVLSSSPEGGRKTYFKLKFITLHIASFGSAPCLCPLSKAVLINLLKR